jgi:hypothetical protein
MRRLKFINVPAPVCAFIPSSSAGYSFTPVVTDFALVVRMYIRAGIFGTERSGSVFRF